MIALLHQWSQDSANKSPLLCAHQAVLSLWNCEKPFLSLVVFSAEVEQHVGDGMKRENTLRKQIHSPTMLLHDVICQLNASNLEVLISSAQQSRNVATYALSSP